MPNIIQKILISDAGACIRIIVIFYILKWLTLINLPSYMNFDEAYSAYLKVFQKQSPRDVL